MRFQDCVIKSHPTGSRYICNPPVTDTDNDTVILVEGYYDYGQLLINEGWEDCGNKYEGTGEFRAFRKGEDNYIITESPHFYWSYLKATEAAKAFNLTEKADRIKMFEVINRTTMDGLKEKPRDDEIQGWEQAIDGGRKPARGLFRGIPIQRVDAVLDVEADNHLGARHRELNIRMQNMAARAEALREAADRWDGQINPVAEIDMVAVRPGAPLNNRLRRWAGF